MEGVFNSYTQRVRALFRKRTPYQGFEADKLDESLLHSSPIETLQIIKDEGESCLRGYHESEAIITGKAIGVLQVLLPMFIVLFGYSFMEAMKDNKNLILVIASISECVILFISISYIFNLLFPKKVGFIGFEPSKLLISDIVTKDSKEGQHNYLKFKVFSLHNAITKSKNSQDKRVIEYRKAINTLIIGTLIVAVISFLCGLIFYTPFAVS